MSTTLAPQAIPASIAKPAKSWLVSPWFDLLFLANLAWPLAVLLAFLQPLDETNPLSLFQIYFLSTPHRWITLVLVFCDSERFWKDPVKFGGLGLLLVGLGLALVGLAGLVPFAANSLMLLMMVDYVWNAWHFAAQHAGIARIYGRTARPEQSLPHVEFEKTAIRTLVLWVFFRLAIHIGTTTQYGANIAWITPWLGWIDPLMLIAPALLLVREIAAFRPACVGRLMYIGSVLALYSAQLVAIRLQDGPWMMAFFFAGAIFHAVEYLAICNWAVQKRTTGIWNYQITRTGLAVIVFMGLIGAANYFVNAQSVYAWQLATLLVSLLHYAYDGIIWRAKPAKT
ncbi:MAG: hypothetical protein HY289_08660 [Planctomycetes bacterium]|nr:hypothetical protein [Planctomycetota bacterium]